MKTLGINSKSIFIILLSGLIYLFPQIKISGQVPFENAIIDDHSHGHRIICDIDKDGKNDILLADQENHQVAWYKFPTWEKNIVVEIAKYDDYKHYRSCGFAVGDLDGDGDIDAVGRIGHKDDLAGQVLWWENPLPEADPTETWTRHDIGTTHYLKNIETADFNLDGKLDVAGREHERTHVFVQNNPTSWSNVMTTDHDSHEGLTVGDIDRDADPDILLNGFWFENPYPKSLLGEWTNHNIDDKWHKQTGHGWKDNNCNIAIADINGDGFLDPLFAHSELPGFPVSWYSTNDPKNGPWTEHVIEKGYDYCQTMDAADVDNDGDIDILAADFARFGDAPWPVTIYLNNGYQYNGNGSTWQRVDISGKGCYGAVFGDIGSDGDMDVVGNREYQSPGAPSIEIWQNKTSDNKLSLDRWTYIEVDNSRTRFDGKKRGGGGWFGLAMGDLDGDGDKDIVSGKWYYRNPGGDMTGKWERITIQDSTDNLLVVNVDDDEFGDFIAAKCNKQFWVEAKNTKATSWRVTQIGSLPLCNHGTAPQGFNLAKIVPGGKPELLFQDKAIYYVQIPDDPNAGEWPSIVVSQSNGGGEEVVAGDIDGDGDVDICASIRKLKPQDEDKGHVVCWWENPGDGSENWPRHVLGSVINRADRFGLADINGDNRLDVVIGEETRKTDAHLMWFEQPDDPRSENWKRHIVVKQFTMNSMEIADMDRDGDTDIIVNEHRGDKKLQIWENDGKGNFTAHLISQGKEGHLGAQVADMDNDGDLDILSICWDDYPYLHLWRNDAISNHKSR